jgi:chemotaxis protein MotB
MKDKPSEWIVIADLMSGVVAVVMLMLVVSVVQKQAAERSHRAEMAQGAEAQRQHIAGVLAQMKTAFDRQGAAGLVAIDAAAGKVTLHEGAFKRGSACIEPKARAAFAQFEDRIAAYLLQVHGGQIFVEGHTDNRPVKAPVTDIREFCTVYDDNFTLSAARAREARLLLIGRSGAEAARRVVVAGYGDSRPLPGHAPGDDRNRRVELRFATTEANQ